MSAVAPGMCIRGATTMTRSRRCGTAATLVGILIIGLPLPAIAGAPALPARDAEFDREPSWSIPTQAEIEARAGAWLDGLATSAAPDVVSRARAAWNRPAAARVDPLDRIMETVAAVDRQAADLGQSLAGRGQMAGPPTWLKDGPLSTFAGEAVALWAGRELVRADSFDEALPFLA
jgi:hypothetical protein